MWIEIRRYYIYENNIYRSPPTWVVWIEMWWRLYHTTNIFVTTHMGGVDWNTYIVTIIFRYCVTTHMGGVDWNNQSFCLWHIFKWSPPTWVVWIEILRSLRVRLLIESHHPHGWCGLKYHAEVSYIVADSHHPHGWCGLKLLFNCFKVIEMPVTTHMGGVDWNHIQIIKYHKNTSSPPTWVVWIEIRLQYHLAKAYIVTTHMGGVDWNCYYNLA